LVIAAYDPDPALAALYHSYGHKIFSYCNPQVGAELPRTYRQNYGLLLWQKDYDGAMDYAYQAAFGFIWNDFDNDTYKDHVFAYPTMNGVIDTIQWEGWREAVDDIRYLTTLLEVIEEAKADARDTSSAESWLAELKNADLATKDLDTVRSEMIDHILSLSYHPPVLDPVGNKSVNEGELLQFAISATDADGDSLTYSASNLPTGASFDAGTRTFSWTPSFDQAGTYSDIHFEVSDGELTDSENITITVSNVNRPPVLNAIGNKSINEGEILEFTISASDPDADPLTYTASNLPLGASFNAGTRAFSWTPSFDQAGTYSNVHFEVSDGQYTDSEDITITVNAPTPSGGGGGGGGGSALPINSPPLLDNIGDKLVGEGDLLEFNILATDSNGDLLTYSVSNLPSGASFDSGTRTFSWTPTSGQAGTYSNIHFEVFDGKAIVSEEITITVLENNRPVLDAIGSKSTTEGGLLEFTISATDPDGDSLTYSVSNLPSGASFNPENQTFSWTPSSGQAGTYTNVHFEASDVVSNDFENVTITVYIPDTTPPEIAEIMTSEITQDSVEICWTTDEPSTSQVKYWASPSKVTPLDENLVTHHVVRINDLTPGANYYYKILSRDTKGNIVVSPTGAFTTPVESASFTVSELDIYPVESHIGEEMTISVLVTNNGDTAGSCQVVLSIDDATETNEQIVSLAAGASQRVFFTVIKKVGGTFTINVNGIEGSLVVTEEVTEAESESSSEEVTGLEPWSSLLRVNPRFDIKTGKLASARIRYQLSGPYESMSEVELALQVNLDGASLETVPVLLPSELGTDGINGSLDYVPSQGWSSGVYTFQAQLYEGERLLSSTNIDELEVTPTHLAGFVVKEVQWVILGIIIGGALIVVELTLLIILRRRRDMFRSHAY